MTWLQRLRTLFRKDKTAHDLDDELQLHLDMLVDENIAAGMSEAEARYAARRAFGSMEPLKEECRSARGLDWLDAIGQDLRFAFRSYRRRPRFALTVVAVLAIGIGASTAVFSAVDRVLFRGFPYRDADRLVTLGISLPTLNFDFLTAATYLDFKRDPQQFSAVTSWSGTSDCDVTDDRPVRLSCARVEASFLPVLGVEPALGRNFTAPEDQPGAARVALISHSLWKSRFGSDTGIVGRRLPLDGQPVLIVGVLPENFELPALDRADLLIPQALPANPAIGTRPLRIYGRLAPGITGVEARHRMAARAEQLLTEIPPHARKQVQFHVTALRELRTKDSRAASWALFGAVLAMLLIACANAANLLLARTMAQGREFAIRAALGASRGRIARQVLTESLLLSLAAGALGCLVAAGLLEAFAQIAPKGLPYLAWASMDGRVLLFAFACAVLSGAAFGLIPALRRHCGDLTAGARTTVASHLFGRNVLVGSQLAISLVLLAGAGLLLQSLWNRERLTLGVRTEQIVTAQIALGPRYAQQARRVQFYEDLKARLERLPGIDSVALSDSLPPGATSRNQPIWAIQVAGKPPAEQSIAAGVAAWRSVTPEYFPALGIQTIRGRTFTEEDRAAGAEPSLVLSQSLAKRLFASEDAVGKKLKRFPDSGPPAPPGAPPRPPQPWYTVVGVVADVRNGGLADKTDPEYYVVRGRSAAVYDDAPMASALIVRGPANPDAIQSWVRAEIAALDPALPVVVRPFGEHIGELAARPRFQAMLVTLFAFIGLAVAAIGLHSLVSFLVTQRQREIGVRLALGATRSEIRNMILAHALRWTVAGLSAGLIVSVIAARFLRGMLFHVSPVDPVTFGTAAGALAAIAIGSALAPSQRAASVDPAVTLRED